MNKAYDISTVVHATSQPSSIRHLSREHATSQPSTYDISAVSIRHPAVGSTVGMPFKQGLLARIKEQGFLAGFCSRVSSNTFSTLRPAGATGVRAADLVEKQRQNLKGLQAKKNPEVFHG